MTKTEDNRIRRLYTMDNLPVLRSIDSETADLIYLDPLFNSGKQWKNPFGEGTRAAPLQDTWELPDTPADKEEALPMTSDTNFSLAAGAFTRDMSRVLRMARRLDAGTVYTKEYLADEMVSPFFWDSGRERRLEMLANYTRGKNIVINIGRVK